MGARFGGNPSVIGWQLDNEYNRICYCDRCRDHFQVFLRQRYCSLDALNEAWSTVYWSQTYTDWSQIPIPIGPHNPGRDPGAPGDKHTDYTAIDVNEGGTAIPYWMEDPFISAEYEAKLKAEGVASRMEPAFYQKGAVVPKFAGA